MTKFKKLQSQEIISITEITFCYNSSLVGEYIYLFIYRVVTRGGCLFINSCSAILISFEINLIEQLISKEISRLSKAKHESEPFLRD